MSNPNGYWVYVIESLVGGYRYSGLSRNVEERLATHNAGKVISTKAHRPFVVIHSEFVGAYSPARLRERFLKSTSGRRFIDSIIPRKEVRGSPPA
jgi:putative endonuclease